MNEAPRPGLDEGFTGLFQHHHGRLVRFVMMLGAPFDQAQDIVQDAFADLYQRWHNVESPERWLRVVCHRKLVDDWRRQRLTPEPVGDIAALQLREPAAPQSDPNEFLTVLEHLKMLPSRQRAVLALSIDGFRTTEIAEILNTNPVNVRANLSHARKALRESLGDQAIIPEVSPREAHHQ